MADNPAPPSHLFTSATAPRQGKPNGTRDKLSRRFWNDLSGLWEEQGDAVLRRAAFEKPMEFAKMVASLMPAKIEISTPTAGMTDEQFERLLDYADTQLRLSAERVGGVLPVPAIEGVLIKGQEGEGGPPLSGVRGEKEGYFPYPDPNRGPLFTGPTDLGDPNLGRGSQADPISRPAETPEPDPLADSLDPADLY